MCISKHEASLVWLQVCECCQNIAEQMWAAVVVKLSAYSPSTLTIRAQILLKPTVYFCKNMAGVGPLNKYCLREADREREREREHDEKERARRKKKDADQARQSHYEYSIFFLLLFHSRLKMRPQRRIGATIFCMKRRLSSYVGHESTLGKIGLSLGKRFPEKRGVDIFLTKFVV